MQSQTKILVVDDDPDIRDAVSTILEAHSYQVVTANNGEEGLKKLKEERPDLMILDLLMPKLDGFGVLKEIQDPRWAKYCKIPILILTSIKEDVSRRRYELETGLDLNIDDYVEKPINPGILMERVKKLLDKRIQS
ncbi:MAG: response regulator [Nitrososphaerota archaeon]|nr:response regulator [Nitrososphaerota archaeon]